MFYKHLFIFFEVKNPLKINIFLKWKLKISLFINFDTLE